MDRPTSRLSLRSSHLASSIVLGVFFATTGDALAQTPPAENRQSATSKGGAAAAPAGADRQGAKAAAGIARGPARPRNEPSETYRESIRRTVERRRERRANRGQGTSDSRPIGGIVPWPMPPALVIRHTSEVHDEIDSFLRLLRK
jgi:hypothetical protein